MFGEIKDKFESAKRFVVDREAWLNNYKKENELRKKYQGRVFLMGEKVWTSESSRHYTHTYNAKVVEVGIFPIEVEHKYIKGICFTFEAHDLTTEATQTHYVLLDTTTRSFEHKFDTVEAMKQDDTVEAEARFNEVLLLDNLAKQLYSSEQPTKSYIVYGQLTPKG